ncbi:hypothetical protein OSJ77_20020 [Phyllobacterium sp. 0TCS1.6C]|uniref:hypothetical protein n=1 Tax=unclassified Phyllobacterium TaxID=2638441 RepID=UPI002264D510|nr:MULTISPECIES: hypothetical protein [unclassified Phyllobacterium]MCX8282482.1 hypothetical protein [Phyllobacterium sp. 0TCS1.6C]MCX8292574.1 hypothetical protein [Phyllobacterium sp. 0TCS1.6A]
MFDLSQFDGLAAKLEEGFDLDILHPATGEKTGLVVKVVSYRSERVKRVQRRLANEALREGKKNPKKIGTVEEIEERTNEIVAASIIGWNLTQGGKSVECTPDNVLKVISNPDYFFISEQVDKAADEDAHFVKPSQKS